MQKKESKEEDFKPTFYGFTGGMKEGETMSEFVKRVNKEGGR